MTKEIVKFVCFDGTTFTEEFMVKDDESSKDIIETFIYNYNYNKGKTCLEEMCCYAYQLLTVEII